jgi:AcrR family transcriptional regulator
MARTSSSGRPGDPDPELLWSEPERPRLGRPPAHDRDEITAAAVAMADAEGLPAVTMRGVAARIGAGTMSLYTYVRDKETLLELMIEHVSGEAPPPEPTGDWRADLRGYAHAQRALARRHPWLAPALARRRTIGPNTLAAMEFALAALEPTGLDGRARLEIFALLTGFVANHVTYELAQESANERSGRTSRELLDAQARYLRAAVETGRYPRLARTLGEPGEAAADPESGFGRLLDRMINGLVAG